MRLCPRGCGRPSRRLLIARTKQPVLCRACHLARDTAREGWTAYHTGRIDAAVARHLDAIQARRRGAA
jgi:hypothetical protein